MRREWSSVTSGGRNRAKMVIGCQDLLSFLHCLPTQLISEKRNRAYFQRITNAKLSELWKSMDNLRFQKALRIFASITDIFSRCILCLYFTTDFVFFSVTTKLKVVVALFLNGCNRCRCCKNLLPSGPVKSRN